MTANAAGGDATKVRPLALGVAAAGVDEAVRSRAAKESARVDQLLERNTNNAASNADAMDSD